MRRIAEADRRSHAFVARGAAEAVGPGGTDDATFTIVGGTGRYLGASGTYHAAQRPREHGGDGTATLTFDITTPEA